MYRRNTPARIGGAKLGAGVTVAALVTAATLLAQNPSIQPKGGQGLGHGQLVAKALRIKRLVKLDVDLPVLKAQDFQINFGSNPDVPKNSAALRALSKRVFTVEGRNSLEECPEYEVGLVMAAMMNPEISDADREAVDGDSDAAMPAFNKTYTSGHFKFYYTDNNANTNHNCTLANIQATATVLNNAWNDFALNFKVPKHYVSGGKQMLDVKCYDLGDSLFGVTNSAWNHMELNSNKVIKSATKRQTTPVHELFHRVQYSHGYVTGTSNMKWAVEATASWSQKYRAPAVGDWMDRINAGLNTPDASLTSRSYDVCGMWCYMGQRAGNERNFVKNVWLSYSTNGKNMINALNTRIPAMIGPGLTLDHVIGWWNFTNFYKDMTNASASFDYAEDELSTPSGYGPLGTVPKTTKALALGGSATTAGSASAYGADYHVWNLGAGIKKVEVKITTSGKFGYAIIRMKNGANAGYKRTPAGGNGTYTFTETFSVGAVDKIALVVIGNPTGGSYSVTAKAT